MFTLKLYVVCADVEISGRKIGGGGVVGVVLKTPSW